MLEPEIIDGQRRVPVGLLGLLAPEGPAAALPLAQLGPAARSSGPVQEIKPCNASKRPRTGPEAG
jgi:hypothetical protein